MDGSNPITLRNRRFLRKIYPVFDGPKFYTLKTLDLLTNSESLRQQPSKEAMDTDRGVNIASPSGLHEPKVEEMKVDNAFRYDRRQHRIPTLGPTPTVMTNFASQGTSAKNFVPTNARTIA